MATYLPGSRRTATMMSYPHYSIGQALVHSVRGQILSITLQPRQVIDQPSKFKLNFCAAKDVRKGSGPRPACTVGGQQRRG